MDRIHKGLIVNGFAEKGFHAQPTNTLTVGSIVEGGHNDYRSGASLRVHFFQKVQAGDARHVKVRYNTVAGLKVLAFDEGIDGGEIKGMESGGFQQPPQRPSNGPIFI